MREFIQNYYWRRKRQGSEVKASVVVGGGYFDLLGEPISFPELPLEADCSPSSRGLLGLARGLGVLAPATWRKQFSQITSERHLPCREPNGARWGPITLAVWKSTLNGLVSTKE